MRLTDFLENIGRPVAYYPSLVKITGSVCAGIFLCQLLYWRGKQTDPEGWIYKTQAEISEETGLSRCEQETARRLLREKGLIREKFADVPRKLYFNVCIDEINEEWMKVQNSLKNPHNADGFPEEDEKTFKNQHNAENQHYIMRETSIIECRKPALLNAENQHYNNTENTTEITTENITENIKYSLSDKPKRQSTKGEKNKAPSLFQFSENQPPGKGEGGGHRMEKESPARQLLLYFAEEYEKNFGIPYNINWGKEMKLFSFLLKRYEPEKIKKAVRWYFRTKDEFFFLNGYSVGVFYQKFNAILLSGSNSIGEIADRLVEEQMRRAKQCSQNQA